MRSCGAEVPDSHAQASHVVDGPTWAGFPPLSGDDDAERRIRIHAIRIRRKVDGINKGL